ncbi:MAG: LytR C-terminal domain-containing protein [Candidatus Latescibacteria bacterium]|nr:LytR C-terminal domain-containing protein [Candidatus Latescibacterota bacterium]
MQERVLWLLAIAAGAILLMAALRPYFAAKEEPAPLSSPPPSSPQVNPDLHVRVAVLNGCGESQVAGRLTKKLRGLGCDVIYEGNAENFNFLQSMVVDRRGDLDKARRVAAVLGLPHLQQVSEDTFRLEEVAVIIGRDYRQVRLLDE